MRDAPRPAVWEAQERVALEDWERANSWKSPSMIWTSVDTGPDNVIGVVCYMQNAYPRLV